MPIDVNCPGCAAPYRVADEHAGKKMQCPACRTVLVVSEGLPKLVPLDDPSGGGYAMADDSQQAASRQRDTKTFWQDVLFECRELLGPAPREFEGEELAYFTLKASFACWIGLDRLGTQYRHQDRLRDRGQVVWGHLVQANEMLFNPQDRGDYPAEVIYSADPYFDSQPDALEALAGKLFELKGTRPKDKDLRQLVAQITDEMARPLQMQIPGKCFGGHEAYMGAIYIHRKHLPQGYLAQGVFPLLINPEETTTVMLLPARYWSDMLLAMWQE